MAIEYKRTKWSRVSSCKPAILKIGCSSKGSIWVVKINSVFYNSDDIYMKMRIGAWRNEHCHTTWCGYPHVCQITTLPHFWQSTSKLWKPRYMRKAYLGIKYYIAVSTHRQAIRKIPRLASLQLPTKFKCCCSTDERLVLYSSRNSKIMYIICYLPQSSTVSSRDVYFWDNMCLILTTSTCLYPLLR